MRQPGLRAPKSEWRRWARAQPVPASVADAVRALLGPLLVGTRSVAAYAALPDEVPVDDLVPAGAHLVLPRLEADGSPTWREADRGETHALGMRQPSGRASLADPAEIDVVLVPGLAFDSSGTRVGRGGGHYDRLLAGVSADARLIAVTCSARVVDRLPSEAHDIRVTHICSEHCVVAV